MDDAFCIFRLIQVEQMSTFFEYRLYKRFTQPQPSEFILGGLIGRTDGLFWKFSL